jgi:hypothetical protein
VLITNVNSPSERIVTGRVSKIKIGFINAFNNPSTSAAMRAVPRPLTATPGNTYAVNMIASAFRIHFKIIFIDSLVLIFCENIH